jgi:colicin import membrane protein
MHAVWVHPLVRVHVRMHCLHRRHRKGPGALAILALALLVSSALPAGAQGNDDHATAEAIVKQIAADKVRAAVSAEPLARARTALERATRLRSAGDEAHAKAADGLAREWAEDARDVARAAEAEAAAAEVRRKAVSAQEQLERTRALVEEAIAHIGRLQAELDQAERSTQKASGGSAPAAGSKSRRAVEAHAAEPPSSSGGAAKGGQKATADRKAASGGAPP